MDFIEKKENFARLIEQYIENQDSESELLNTIKELSQDDDFKNKDLFKNLFEELTKYLPELSRKELKQRVLLVRSYLD